MWLGFQLTKTQMVVKKMANHLKQTTSFKEGVFSHFFCTLRFGYQKYNRFPGNSAFQKYHATFDEPSNHVIRIGPETVHGEFRSVQFQGSAGWFS